MAKRGRAAALKPLLQDPRYPAFIARYAHDLDRFAVEVCGLTLSQQQEEFARSVERVGSRTTVSSGHGCFAAGTMVMRADGRAVAVEDVKAGDMLMGGDGSSRRLVEELKRGQEPMWRFTLNDGSAYVFNESHVLWLERGGKIEQREGPGQIRVTVREWLGWSADRKRLHYFVRRPVERYDAPARPLEVDPYMLGLWLGDGDTRTTTLTSGDPELLEAWAQYAEGLGLRATIRRNSTRSWRMRASAPRLTTDNPLARALKVAGFGRAKHIPAHYLTAPRLDRLELLAGLLDSDGHLDASGSSYDFSQKCERLARDVARLARSVGCNATIRSCRKGCQTGAVGTYWRVTIGRNLSAIPTRLQRFRDRLPTVTQRDRLRFGIRSAEPLGEGEFYGFTLDGDGLFLLADHTVVSNTGKTNLAACIALWHLTCYTMSNTIVSGPKLEIVLTGIRKYMADLHAQIESGPHAWIAQHIVIGHRQAYIRNYKAQWWVAAKTAPAGKPEAMAGEHRKYLLWLIDEASGVDDKVMGVILGSLTEDWNRIVLMSQPTRGQGFFYETHHKLSEAQGGTWRAITMNSEDSPFVSDTFIVEKLRQYGGRNDPQYMIKVRGQFPDKLEGILLSRTQLEACIGRASVIRPGDTWGWVISIDVAAGEYRDRSVVTVAKVSGAGQHHERNPRKVHVVSVPIASSSMQPTELIGRIVELSGRLENATIMIDCGGIGLFVYKKLAELGVPGLVKVLWGAPCWAKAMKESYANQRAQAMVMYAKAAIHGLLSIDPRAFPDSLVQSDFLNQSRIPYHYNDAAQYVIESKGSKEWEGLPSPDIVDSGSFLFLESCQFIPVADRAERSEGAVAASVERMRAMRAAQQPT